MARVCVKVICLCLAATWLCAFGANAQVSDGLLIRSKDWMNPQLRDIHTQITVTRKKSQMFSLSFVFDVPVPEGGVDPTAVHFFSVCLAGYISAKEGFPAWALGTANPNLNYSNTKRMELLLTALKEGEQPENPVAGSDITWFTQNVNNDANFRESCRRILRAEYVL